MWRLTAHSSAPSRRAWISPTLNGPSADLRMSFRASFAAPKRRRWTILARGAQSAESAAQSRRSCSAKLDRGFRVRKCGRHPHSGTKAPPRAGLSRFWDRPRAAPRPLRLSARTPGHSSAAAAPDHRPRGPGHPASGRTRPSGRAGFMPSSYPPFTRLERCPESDYIPANRWFYTTCRRVGGTR